MGRRCVVPIVVLAAALHAVGLARSSLPAQDGLKFLRVARDFSSRSWIDVIRSSDQHPLYPASIAIVHPVVSLWAGSGADSWRIAAGMVSLLASIALLLPLYGLSRALFDPPTAALTALLFVLLPIPAEIGHDTLSDALALLLFVGSLRLGEVALRTAKLLPAISCGIVAGLGYLARPEVAIVPVAVLISAAPGLIPLGKRVLRPAIPRDFGRFAAMLLALFVVVGAYAAIKGEVSEKLALRRFAAIASKHDSAEKTLHPLPPGLDDPRWDFSAKEEFGDAPRWNFMAASARLASRYAEAMGWFGVPLVFWGVLRVRAGSGRWLIGVFAALFASALIRHAMTLGYLSSRHTLSLVAASLPWASAGMLDVAAQARSWLGDRNLNRRRGIALLAMIAAGAGVQLYRSPHSSRWGHAEAGRWLAAHSAASDKVLDTRGWAAFASGRRGVDYWHVRQALVDPELAFVVVGGDELKAPTRRAETLRSLLAFAAEPAASFADRRGGSHADVLVYRYLHPADWRGMRP